MKQQSTATLHDADLQLLKLALVRDRNLKVCIGLLLVLVSIGCIILLARQFTPKTVYSLSFLLVFVGFAGVYFLIQGLLRYDTQSNFLLQLINYNPQLVVWVYYRKIESAPFGIRMMQFTTLFIFLSNREFIALPMPEREILTLLPKLKKRAPHAVFGYSKQREQLYNVSPDLLINPENRS